MSELKFAKMNGWGNDFVVIEGPIRLDVADIVALCDRRFGVGADGVLVVTPGDPIGMDYWNADGSVAEMCGNGLRCVARYASDRGLVSGDEFVIDTPVGPRKARIHMSEVEVELGPVKVTGHADIDGDKYHLIDVGNPHAVVEVEDPALANVAEIGPKVSSRAEFPDGVNVEFVRFEGNELSMRVWERGVGETLACGTGMVAAAFVATKAVKMATPIIVNVPGGQGSVDFEDGTGWLRGPASYSFEGVWDRPLTAQG
jgi:diaminopimelate epimerase